MRSCGGINGLERHPGLARGASRFWFAAAVAMICLWLAGCAGSGGSGPPTTAQPETGPDADEWEGARTQMVEDTILARGVSDPNVIRAMLEVPRERFVPEEFRDQAYDDHPLPIGYGQTISQPYIVAWMTELLELKSGEKVLEVGTGSGYQAAVLAELGLAEVYTIEIIPELANLAKSRLEAAGDTNVRTATGDGYYGWLEAAPFDAIIVTAAPDHLPSPLVQQLAEGGRLVVPIGPAGGYQALWLFRKSSGELTAYNMGGVSFVPLLGEGTSGPAPTASP